MKRSYSRIPVFVLASAVAVFSLIASLMLVQPTVAQSGASRWVTGDIHTHTYLTDGSHVESEVVAKAFATYGLDFMANSEHGGVSARDPNGITWDQTGVTLLGDSVKAADSAGVQRAAMWRWQSLRDISWPLVAGLQPQYPNKVLFQSVEWNVPGHEHASVGLAEQANGYQISIFEYMFDASDKDTSLKADLPKYSTKHADAVTAAGYLQERFPQTAYIVLNHPSRSQAFSAADIRDLNNAAPSVVFGLEGLPGHQKEPARGGYDRKYYLDAAKKNLDTVKTNKARTYGGADLMLAKVGGLMDSLWGEGRRFWVFVNSDFHSSADNADFWPGEYAKTYTNLSTFTQQGIVDGMRSGNVFVAHGDLINALDFHVTAGSDVKTMGQELVVAKGAEATVTIRFKSPAANNSGSPVKVDHIDLIIGDVTGKFAPGSANYKSETNPTTRVVATFFSSDWKTDAEGYQTLTFKLPALQKNQYLRLRGTNLGLNVSNQTQGGNPLNDDLMGSNTKAKAYADLWFYTNPIFITVK